MKTMRQLCSNIVKVYRKSVTFLKVKIRSGEVASVRRDRNFTTGKNCNENYMGKL